MHNIFELKKLDDTGDFMEDGHFIDIKDKIAVELFWEHVIFKEYLPDEVSLVNIV